NTEIALGHLLGFGIHLRRTIGARPRTSSATHTFIRIDHHDAIPFTLVHGSSWAIFYAHWVDAVVTRDRQGVGEHVVLPTAAAIFDKFSARDLINPTKFTSNFEIIFIFAGNLTRFAS